MRARSLTLSSVLACGLFVAIATNSPAATEAQREMRVENGRLSATISGAQLSEVMARFTELTGIQVVWQTRDVDEAVSVRFTGLSPAEAIARLLRERNYIVGRIAGNRNLRVMVGSRTRSASDGRVAPPASGPLQAVRFDGHGAAASITEATSSVTDEALPSGDDAAVEHFREAATSGSPGEDRIETIRQLAHNADAPDTKTVLATVIATDGDVRVRRSALSALAGAETVPLDTLIAATQNDRDPRIRRQALAILARVADDETREELLGQTAHDDSHPRLRRMAHRLGNRAPR